MGYWIVTKPFRKKSGSVKNVISKIDRRLRKIERGIKITFHKEHYPVLDKKF